MFTTSRAMSNKSVPKLEHLAFMASYKDIFNNLSLICDYESKNFDGDEDDSLENETSFTSLYETINCVRYHLSQHLIGTMNDTTRYNPPSFSIFKLHTYYYIHCIHLCTYYTGKRFCRSYTKLYANSRTKFFISGAAPSIIDLMIYIDHIF